MNHFRIIFIAEVQLQSAFQQILTNLYKHLCTKPILSLEGLEGMETDCILEKDALS